MDYNINRTKKRIIEVRFDYSPAVSDGNDIYPEDYECAKITDDNVEGIHEHTPEGDGDKWFYDIVHTDGTIIRTFNPCFVKYALQHKK